jgi:D-hexose-6-phosphate mutarotase
MEYRRPREAETDLQLTRKAMLEALAASVRGEVPEFGPRGGKRWTARYFVRREAWHVLDHAWEIEDRSVRE